MTVGCEFHIEVSKDLAVLQERVDKSENLLEDVLVRTVALEVTGARHDEKFITLCEKMQEVMDTLKDWMQFAQALYWKVLAAAGVAITIFVGFFVWYVQSLPRT